MDSDADIDMGLDESGHRQESTMASDALQLRLAAPSEATSVKIIKKRDRENEDFTPKGPFESNQSNGIDDARDYARDDLIAFLGKSGLDAASIVDQFEIHVKPVKKGRGDVRKSSTPLTGFTVSVQMAAFCSRSRTC
jgi:hypothetical protein